MLAAVAVVALLALLGAGALVYFVAGGSARGRARTTWLGAAFAVAVLIAFAVFNFAQVNYVWPIGWIIALVAAVIIPAALFIRVAMDVRWRPVRVLALVGIAILAAVAFAALGMSGVGSGLVQPLYKARAAQIAEANGFTALMPSGEELPTDSLPVDTLPAPDAGLSLNYGDYWIQERKALASMTAADLTALVAPGVSPMAGGPVVPQGTTTSTHTVQGRPAVGVEYSVSPKGGPPEGSKQFTNVVLVTELNGVEVRIASESGVRESGGTWVPFSNASIEDLVRIAESLEPVD